MAMNTLYFSFLLNLCEKGLTIIIFFHVSNFISSSINFYYFRKFAMKMYFTKKHKSFCSGSLGLPTMLLSKKKSVSCTSTARGRNSQRSVNRDWIVNSFVLLSTYIIILLHSFSLFLMHCTAILRNIIIKTCERERDMIDVIL